MTQPKIDIDAIRAKLAAMKAGTSTEEKIVVAQSALAEARAEPVAPVAPVTTPPADAKSIIDTMQLVKDKPESAVVSTQAEYLAELDLADLKTKITNLSSIIQTAHPTMPVLLREIHTTLKKQPDNVTLLDETEIGIIVSGLLKHTNVVLSTKMMKTKTKSTKSISVDDL